mmetsp:Transcript_30617/g.51574  ORF Transcript_30617/g.51574 Transcript_30617/m.51574 type:complete len:337 (+) Transcript_30617:1478-2488(+)
MALEVKVHALAEAGLAEKGLVQADHLRALLVDCHRVEVVHLNVRVGADRMRHGAGVLGKLCSPEADDVVDALHPAVVQVRAELLVAEHRQALLQGQLEPVLASNAVARPVVEVLVPHHRLDLIVVGVGGSCRGGQHELGVEHVERFVLHGAHVEVVHRHNVEQVQVVLQPVGVLVPLHGLLEGGHGVGALVDVVLLRENAQDHRAPAHGLVGVLDVGQVTGHQRKQVARLDEGILPHRKMLAALQVAGVRQVAVAQEDGVLGLVAGDAGSEGGHHIRAVRIVRDVAEALRLALCAEVAGGLVESVQAGVVDWVNLHGGGQSEVCRRGVLDDQKLLG